MIACMNYKALASIALAAAIAFARPVAFVAQEAGKAADILAMARKAIADKKLESLKTFTVQSGMQRNIGNMTVNSDIEILVELPDKFLKTETSSGGGMVMAGAGVSGFNGDRLLQKAGAGGFPGGGMIFRVGGAPGPVPVANSEKPTPEQLEQLNQAMLRSARTDASRLMLGWFAMAHPSINAQYTYLGEAESPDGRAYVIEVKSGDSFDARLFIDEQTNLPLMVTYRAPQPRMVQAGAGQQTAGGGGHVVTQTAQRPASDEERKNAMADAQKQMREPQRLPPVMADYTLFFEDWRDAEGMKFPFRIRRAMGRDTTEEWTVSKIKVNPKIDPKKFAVESGS
jgi:hypothetical protein